MTCSTVRPRCAATASGVFSIRRAATVAPTMFRAFDEPGFAKTIYALGTDRLTDDKTLLWAMMRTATTDEHARAWFRRYWTLGVGAGAHVLAHGLLDSVREDAEAV